MQANNLAAERRLPLTRQHLSGRRAARGAREAILRTVGDLRHVQLDPRSTPAWTAPRSASS